MNTREQWPAERRKGIGGSDVASLFNIGYGCRKRLWYDKTNTPEDFPREETDAMALGSFLEPWFASKYEKSTGRAVVINSVPFVHPRHPELRVNVDRTIFMKDRSMGVLEIKSMGRAMFYKTKREGLPEDYILQLQHAMLVSNVSWGSFAIGCRDNGDLMSWDVDADTDIHAQILEEGPKFWAAVENGPMPDALEPDDRRCQECSWRVTCHGDSLIQLGPQSDYTPDESLVPLVAEFIERRELHNEAKDLFEETKAEIEARLGDRTMVTAMGAKIQFWETEVKGYTVQPRKQRTLRIYPRKEK